MKMEHLEHMAQILPGPDGSRAPPPLPDHLVEEILVRVASPADLARAAAACASFRRLVAAASFLRRYRSLHPPLLLGVLTARMFLPAEAPHPNALTAHAFVRATDLFLAHLRPRQRTCWMYCDARDGRVLLIRYRHPGGHILPELAVFDPLTRGRTPLPTIPESLVASFVGPRREFTAFFVPAADYEGAQFRVIAWAYCEALAVASVYSSLSGTWSDRISISSDPPGFRIQSKCVPPLDLWPSYAYGCFYWKLQSCGKMLKLDVNRMEFSVVVLPPNHKIGYVVVVEAGEGRIGIITYPTQYDPELLHSIWQNEIGNDNEHTSETAISLPSDHHFYFVFGAAEGYIIIVGFEKPSDTSLTFFSLNIKTLEIVRVCSTSLEVHLEVDHYHYTPFLYFGYPPFLSPRRI